MIYTSTSIFYIPSPVFFLGSFLMELWRHVDPYVDTRPVPTSDDFIPAVLFPASTFASHHRGQYSY